MVMISSVKTPGAVQAGPFMSHGAAKGGLAQAAVPAALGTLATTVRARRGQALALACDGSDMAFIVRSGALILHITLPGSSRQVAALLFPGDLIRSSFAPPHSEATLVAAAAAEVWRMRFSAIETLAGSDPAIMRFVGDAAASRIMRQALHAATLGQLDCEQRVATLLVELALRTGTSAPAGGIVFDLPFSREDIADYLGLNPDTLSRVMSCFRAAPFVSKTDRNRILVRDFAALAARSPAARPLMAMSRSHALDLSPGTGA